jgi:hypothetical protein
MAATNATQLRSIHREAVGASWSAQQPETDI